MHDVSINTFIFNGVPSACKRKLVFHYGWLEPIWICWSFPPIIQDFSSLIKRSHYPVCAWFHWISPRHVFLWCAAVYVCIILIALFSLSAFSDVLMPPRDSMMRLPWQHEGVTWGLFVRPHRQQRRTWWHRWIITRKRSSFVLFLLLFHMLIQYKFIITAVLHVDCLSFNLYGFIRKVYWASVVPFVHVGADTMLHSKRCSRAPCQAWWSGEKAQLIGFSFTDFQERNCRVTCPL